MMPRSQNAAPSSASIAAAAESHATADDDLDGLITRWLIGTAGDFTDDIVAVPGWRRATAAESLLLNLLPTWRLDRLSSATSAVLISPAGACITATGPTFARAILAATFRALAEAEVDPMAELRGALRGELEGASL